MDAPAGAVIFGKTNVPLSLAEWQSYNEIYGTTLNPWDQSKTPGGSSGGSAAALATGMTMLEAGSDIGSSIRNPAHYSGVFGHKPTWGVVPMQGHLPPDWHTDIDIAVTGPMARSARDLTLAFEIIAGADDANSNQWKINCPHDTRTKLSEFKVAVKLDDAVCPVDQGYIDTMTDFVKKLEAAGAQVSWNTEPELDSQSYFDLYIKLLAAAQAFGYTEEQNIPEEKHLEANATGVALKMQRMRIAGRRMGHGEWQRLDNERIKMRNLFNAFFQNYDILLTPVTVSSAFPSQQKPVRYLRTIPVNDTTQPEYQQLFWAGYSCLIGLPTTVGRAGFVDHLPVGYQATTGTGCDYTSLAFAEAVEREVIGFTPPPDL
jgi:amidase